MVEKISLSMDMLKGEGSVVLFDGEITDRIINFYGWGDRDKPLKFIVCKGYIDDWCVYVESMDEEQSYEKVARVGNKISPSMASLLIDCSDEVLGRYRS